MAERRADPALDEAARVWGVLPAYETQDGRSVRASDASILAALRALGAPVDGPADLSDAVRVGRVERWTTLVEPVVVSRADAPATVEVRLLAAEAAAAVHCELTREDGSEAEWTVRFDDLVDVAVEPLEGREYLSGRLRVPVDLPTGYHGLTVRCGPRHAHARVIRAPARAWTPASEGAGEDPRGWGLFLPLYALRSGRTPGVADLGDLEALQRWTARRGGEVVATLPLLAAFLEDPLDPSPYAPVSRLFWNELYLDLERAPGLDRAPGAAALLASSAYRAEGARLRAQPRVDYRAVHDHRRAALSRIVAELAPGDAPLPTPLAEFAAERPDAEDYAAFRAVGERQRLGWRSWPAHLRAGSVAERDFDEASFRYHLYAQYATSRQLEAQARGAAGERAALYMDLPLGAHPDGFDSWRWRDLFADASVGAPPDALFAGGQDWGFPPVHPRRARAGGHEYWAASLRHLMGVSGMVRLDHVLGLHRLFWIPRGIPARDGVYVRSPAEELYAVLCLESHRNRTEVVGEDLGTVPAGVREAMAEHRVRRMFVVPFELDAEHAALAPVPPGSVASLNTHDMAPFAEWAAPPGAAEALARALDVPAAPVPGLLAGALERLAESPARLVLISLEDLWLETEPQNRPGTASGENWSRKARLALEEMEEAEGVDDTLRTVDAARRRAPRAPAAPARRTARARPR